MVCQGKRCWVCWRRACERGRLGGAVGLSTVQDEKLEN